MIPEPILTETRVHIHVAILKRLSDRYVVGRVIMCWHHVGGGCEWRCQPHDGGWGYKYDAW